MIELTADIPSEALHWRNKEQVRQWCRQYTLIDSQSHERWLKDISTNPKIKMYGIKSINPIPKYIVPDNYRGLHMHVGVCGLTSIDRVNQTAEFSLYIAPEYHRLGYGKEALKELLRVGFNNHNLNRIWGETFDGNPALKMFKAIGMRVEGTLRQSYFRDGHFIDSVIVSMLRGEFNG